MLSLLFAAAATTGWSLFAEGAIAGATAFAIGKGVASNIDSDVM